MIPKAKKPKMHLKVQKNEIVKEALPESLEFPENIDTITLEEPNLSVFEKMNMHNSVIRNMPTKKFMKFLQNAQGKPIELKRELYPVATENNQRGRAPKQAKRETYSHEGAFQKSPAFSNSPNEIKRPNRGKHGSFPVKIQEDENEKLKGKAASLQNRRADQEEEEGVPILVLEAEENQPIIRKISTKNKSNERGGPLEGSTNLEGSKGVSLGSRSEKESSILGNGTVFNQIQAEEEEKKGKRLSPRPGIFEFLSFLKLKG